MRVKAAGTTRTYSARLFLLALAILLLAYGLCGCRSDANPVTDPTGSNDPAQGGNAGPPVPLSPITNLPVIDPGSPVAVSTDNLSRARPQSGLARADIVYEVLAEGGITRYLAIYYSQAPSTVGPVRSARPYLALLAKEWGAIFAHCGGDPKDIAPIKEWKVVDGDEFKYSSLYWRDKSRSAPHNLYTSVENMRTIPSESLPEPEKRYEFEDWSEDPIAGLEIHYGYGYKVQYKYADGSYERVVLDGSLAPFTYADRDTNEKPAVSNVIIQFAKTKVVYSDLGLEIDMIGEGKATYLLGGRFSEGTWKKESVEKPTVFYAADGTKITLTTGQTWVQIVPENTTVKQLPAT